MPSELAQRGPERTPPKKLEWKSNEALAVGKGATVQEFVATVGEDRLEMLQPGVRAISRSTASNLHTLMTPRIGARPSQALSDRRALRAVAGGQVRRQEELPHDSRRQSQAP